MLKLFGIETEYGITREDLDEVDPVVESMALVRAYLETSPKDQGRESTPFRPGWDYGDEDPRKDARGFRADRLAQDEEETAFAESDRQRPFSFHEMKSDLVLTNGARYYNDHTHPEYSTPECGSIRDLVIHDKAGERIVQVCADRRNAEIGSSVVQVYKNNTDLHGHSYGCHDNYLLSRSIPFGEIVRYLTPFLVTRQIFAGAGKLGIEGPEGTRSGTYQLSQRADFIEVETSIDTMVRRPIINTRDEPHADRNRYRRLHQILGDSNCSEVATGLKVGTTWLVLRLIEEGLAPMGGIVSDPVGTIHQVSQDTSCKKPIRLEDKRMISPIDHQGLYLSAAKQAFGSEDDPDTLWILRTWEEVLNDLDADPMRLVHRLDWVAKLWLMETFMEAEGCDWHDPHLPAIDLEYHNLNPDRGLFIGLEKEGVVERLTTGVEIKQAMKKPPSDTRAAIRGLCVERFNAQIYKIQWEKIVFNNGLKKKELDLRGLFDQDNIVSLRNRVKRAVHLKEIFD
ncbi:MAG: proteasome accessory factor PafA2 family protein [Nitrospira sp.]|nr:peptidase [Candidatus Manganitrophaceae bacterium]HIL34023.1 peptidase [Candidatus Manganitrophaceae bacterium]